MTFADPYQDSYPPSLWEAPGRSRTTTEAPAPSYALPADAEHFTIDQIKEWVGDNPDQADEVLAAEQARGDAARSTLVDWLTTQETP